MMSKENDLVRRGDVKAKKVYCRERHEYVVPVAEIDWLPAAPQPMSAVEYERVCRLFGYWCASHRLCSECDFFVDCPHSYKEGYGCAMPTPEERVVAIQKWAQEHPDKVSEGGKEE